MKDTFEFPKDYIEEIFPLEGKITLFDILFTDRYDCQNCIGARSLKRALGDHKSRFLSWGVKAGSIKKTNGHFFLEVTTKENIDFMKSWIPRKVTFIINK